MKLQAVEAGPFPVALTGFQELILYTGLSCLAFVQGRNSVLPQLDKPIFVVSMEVCPFLNRNRRGMDWGMWGKEMEREGGRLW